MNPEIRKKPSPPARNRWLSMIFWNPRPIPRPRVDPDFEYLPGIPRASESIRYNLACLEHWVSPGGELREFSKICVGFALLFLIATLPVAALALFLFQVELVLKSLLNILLSVILITVIIMVLVNVLNRSKSRREDRDEDFDRFRRR